MRPKLKIQVDYEPPPPDPPDEICEVCGSTAMGWWVEACPCPIIICLSCWTLPMKSQRRFKVLGVGRGIEERLWLAFITAVSILWYLEKEIASIKRRGYDEPRGFYSRVDG